MKIDTIEYVPKTNSLYFQNNLGWIHYHHHAEGLVHRYYPIYVNLLILALENQRYRSEHNLS